MNRMTHQRRVVPGTELSVLKFTRVLRPIWNNIPKTKRRADSGKRDNRLNLKCSEMSYATNKEIASAVQSTIKLQHPNDGGRNVKRLIEVDRWMDGRMEGALLNR